MVSVNGRERNARRSRDTSRRRRSRPRAASPCARRSADRPRRRTGRRARRRRAAAAARPRTASTGDLPFFISSVTRWATTSVSVSVANFAPLACQLLAQLAEILDDAVVHDRDAVGGVRMGVALGRLAVGRPAGVADADRARRAARSRSRASRLRSLPSARRRVELAVLQRGDAGGIVAAIFEALERIDQLARDRLAAENSDDSAHVLNRPFAASWRSTSCMRHACRHPENHNACPDVTKSGQQAAPTAQLIRRLRLLLAQRLEVAQALGPAFLNGLPAAAEGQRIAPARRR